MTKKNKAQVGIEYLIVTSFILFVIIGIMGLGFYYLNNFSDSIVSARVNNLGFKITNTAEKVSYAGEPSKATINIQIPKQVKNIEIIENSVVFDVQLSNGVARIAYFSNIDIEGSINIQGSRKLQFVAQENNIINISQV